LALAALAVAGGGARADIVYSDLGPGGSWDKNNAWVVNSSFYQAFAFTPTAATNLSTVELPLGVFSGTNDVKVQVRSSSNNLPGAVLEEFDFQGLGDPFTHTDLSVGESVLHPELMAGQQYWVVVLPGAPDTSAAWNENSIGLFGQTTFSHDGGQTWVVNQFGGGPTAAFEVTGGPAPAVPEPASLVLLGGGALTLVGYGWRRRRRAAGRPKPALTRG
jgi:hypothetical protein